MMETHTGFGGWQGAPQGFGGQGFGQAFGPQPQSWGATTPGARLAEFAGQGGDVADLVRTLVAQRLQTGGGRALNFDIGDLVRAIVAIRMQTGEPLLGGPGPDIGDIVRMVVGARLRGGAMAGQSDVGDLVRGVIGARIQAGGPLLGGESDVGDLVRAVIGARIQSGGPLLDIGDLVKAIVLTHAIQARTAGAQAFGQGFGQHMGGFGYAH